MIVTTNTEVLWLKNVHLTKATFIRVNLSNLHIILGHYYSHNFLNFALYVEDLTLNFTIHMTDSGLFWRSRKGKLKIMGHLIGCPKLWNERSLHLWPWLPRDNQTKIIFIYTMVENSFKDDIVVWVATPPITWFKGSLSKLVYHLRHEKKDFWDWIQAIKTSVLNKCPLIFLIITGMLNIV